MVREHHRAASAQAGSRWGELLRPIVLGSNAWIVLVLLPYARTETSSSSATMMLLLPLGGLGLRALVRLEGTGRGPDGAFELVWNGRVAAHLAPAFPARAEIHGPGTSSGATQLARPLDESGGVEIELAVVDRGPVHVATRPCETSPVRSVPAPDPPNCEELLGWSLCEPPRVS